MQISLGRKVKKYF